MIEEPRITNNERRIVTLFKELTRAIREWFADFFDLQHGVDAEGTLISIRSNRSMRGANAWMLMCSILIASLGLDLNSPAIIIGAMLISPLMSPILGIGLGVATNDREALISSLQHFMVAILISLATSTFYFLITPLGEYTAEIRARTAPTLLDGLVAIFGGLAGIISISRKDKGNALPGVAIATALMPPLCVTGYFLANGRWNLSLNPFYLFFLNSFFIALSAYIIIRLLKFPMRTPIDPKEARRSRFILYFFSIVVIVPSGKILSDLYNERQEEIRIEAFIDDFFGENSPTRCIDHELIQRDSSRQLVLELLGETIPQDSMNRYFKAMQTYDLPNISLSLIQDSDLELEQLKRMETEISTLGALAEKLATVNKVKSEQELRLERMQFLLDSLMKQQLPFEEILTETKIVFPELRTFAFARAELTDFKQTPYLMPVFLVEWKPGKSRYLRRKDEEVLADFLKVRAQLDSLQIVSFSETIKR